MPKGRGATSAVVLAVVIAGGAAVEAQEPAVGVPDRSRYVAPSEPGIFSEPGPLEKRANPITPENPVPRRVYYSAAVYPPEAAAIGARGTVTVRIAIDNLGRVGEARRVGLPPIGSLLPVPPGESAAMKAAEDAMLASALTAVRQWQYDPPAQAPIAIDVAIRFGPDSDPLVASHGPASLAGAAAAVPATAAPGAAPPAPWAEGAVRVGSALRPPVKTRHVNPAYPAEAQSARAQGIVILEARIETDGRVSNARVLRSVPLLDQSALDAVLQWEFTPTLLNGVPVPVIMTVTVQFSLS